MSDVADAFLARRGDRLAPHDEATVRAAVDAACSRAAAAWNGATATPARFGTELAARLDAEGDVLAGLTRVPAADLYLVIACAERDPPALDAFERVFVTDVRGSLERLRFSPAVVDEALQLLRASLLVGDGRAAGILGYGGRGALRGWLRVVALRLAYGVVRANGQALPLPDAGERVATGDLEIEHLKRTYGEAFRSAFRQAFADLGVEDRLLLKQRYAFDMSVADLGLLHGVHGSTISRWATEARGRLLDATRASMMRALGIGASEMASVLRLIESQLDTSVSLSISRV